MGFYQIPFYQSQSRRQTYLQVDLSRARSLAEEGIVMHAIAEAAGLVVLAGGCGRER
jgi:hypothetical protein